MNALYCILYLLITGILIFIIGRLYPRKWISENQFPFNCFKVEKKGKIYERIGIKSWKTKYPDASVIFHRLFPKIYPKKRLNGANGSKICILIKESCVAEVTHFISILSGVFCVKIWQGFGGFAMFFLWMLINIPAIVIQRYNRPRFKKISGTSAEKSPIKANVFKNI